MSKKDYRKKLAKALGFDIPEGFEVHHIDHRRTNDNLDNLVAIPKDLHREYHKYYRRRWSYETRFLESGDRKFITGEKFDQINDRTHYLFKQVMGYYFEQQHFITQN